MQEKLEDVTALTKEIIHGYYRGDLEPCFSHLSKKTVWISTGEQMIVGGAAVRDHLLSRTQHRDFRILRDNYYLLPVSARCAAVAAQVTAGDAKREDARITASYTLLYQAAGVETKLVLIHSGYGLLRPNQPDRDMPVTWVPAYHLFRNLLLDLPEENRLAVPSGGKTFYIHPNTILYVQSKNRRAELCCVDTVVRSDLSINQINAMLPAYYCPIYRCYTVNPRYVSAIRRYQVTMVTGETLPIPFHSYDKVKNSLEHHITGLRDGGGKQKT